MTPSTSVPPVLIIGAGPTGLSAAYHLGARSRLLEREDRVGGWCRSVECDGFTFDLAGHIMFSNDAYVHQLYERLLGDNVHWQDREAWIWSHDVYTRYPFQGSLHGLPSDVIRECLMGAIEARYGAVTPAPATESACDHRFEDCCADGVADLAASAAGIRAVSSAAAPGNFAEFIDKVWGRGIARHFATPYNRKLWAVPLEDMETSWLGGRVPLPDLSEMIEGALSPRPRPMGPNARFGYPLRGGFQSLMNGFVPLLEGPLSLNADVTRVSPERREVTLADGVTHPYDVLVSTMPLPDLIRRIGDEAPDAIREAAAGLRSVSVRCVNLGVGRAGLTDKHWIYYPEDTVFHRIFVQGNASPSCNPPGGCGLTCEITYASGKPLPCDGDALTRLCIEQARQVGLLRESDKIWASCQTDLRCGYVVYDHGRAARVDAIRHWLLERKIVLAGRYAEWEYYNSDHAFLAGRAAAATATALMQAAPALYLAT